MLKHHWSSILHKKTSNKTTQYDNSNETNVSNKNGYYYNVGRGMNP